MKMQTRILLFCGNALLIISHLIDTSIHPGRASYIMGMGGGVLAGALLSFYFEWREKRELKAIEAIENNLTNNL